MIEKTFIYTLSCPDSGLVRYVGKSNNVKQRFKDHLYSFNREKTKKTFWILFLKKQNKKPILEIIDEVPICDWSFWEKHYIKMYTSIGAVLLNSNEGGVDKFGNNFLYTSNHPNKKRVYQLDDKLNLLNTFESMGEASRVTGVNFSTISSVCSGRNGKKSAGGFNWTFDIEKVFTSTKIKKFNRKIIIKNLTTNKTIVFEKISLAAKELNLNTRTVARHCDSGKIVKNKIFGYG